MIINVHYIFPIKNERGKVKQEQLIMINALVIEYFPISLSEDFLTKIIHIYPYFTTY